MLRRILPLLALPLFACHPSSTGGGPGAATPMKDTLATARPLNVGTPVTGLSIPCEATFYFGPFKFANEGDAVKTSTTVLSPSGAQVCGLTASFVDQADAFVTAAGVGCVEGAQPVKMDQEHAFTPGAGGSNANPVYLKFERKEPAGCPALTFSIERAK